ncbi:AraC family transcriptional regulator [Paenibacillus sp. IITD108]|uniref:AraC family transcriptional regulator n=1 Tax=Paenibacillus sp. IITD108 TaxID=3116649 RepID=UPI002F3FFC08
MDINEKTLREDYVVDEVTNSALMVYPVNCVFRTQEIQQPFLHAHSGYEFYMCLAGQGKLLTERGVHELTAGVLTIIAPDALHMPRSAPEEPFHRFILSIDKTYLEGLGGEKQLNEEYEIDYWLPTEEEASLCWQLNARQILVVQDIFVQLERELIERKKCFSLAVRSLILQLFVNLGRYQGIQPALSSSSGERKQIVEGIMDWVAERYAEPLRIEELCSRYHLSRSYLHRIFKQETGLTIMDYLISYRINKAKILLKNDSMSITEIAHCSGFQDLSHFSRIFKRQNGITPRAYRDSGRKTEAYYY